jgi:IPT/TIG domain
MPHDCPEIIDINPRSGPVGGGQRVWIFVRNLRRDINQNYLINFGYAGNVEAHFVSPEQDHLQMLECESPTGPAGKVQLSLRLSCSPSTPIGINTIRFVFFEPSAEYVLLPI